MDISIIPIAAALIASFAVVAFISQQSQAFVAHLSNDRTLPIAAVILTVALGPIIVSQLALLAFGPAVSAWSFAGGLLGGAWGAFVGTGAAKALTNWWLNG